MNRRAAQFVFRPRLGLARGAYVERPLQERGGMDVMVSSWTQRFRGAAWGCSIQSLQRKLETEAGFFEGREESWLDAYIETMRGQLARDVNPGAELMTRALALVSEVNMRVTGRRPSIEDLLMAGGMLGGKVVAHGADCDRGQSLCIAAAVAAWGGVGVHIVSPREPRAMELFERFEGVLERLGISSSGLTQKSSIEERRAAWKAEVVFVGVAALMDEFLKDRQSAQSEGGRASRLVNRLAGGEGAVADMRLRGLQFALLDDASGLLCDFATRPFVVKDREGTEEDLRAKTLASRLADELVEGEDFRLNGPELQAELMPEGEARLDTIQGVVSGPLARPLSRRPLIEGAVVAQHLLQRDRHYEVNENRIEFKLEGELIAGTEARPDDALKALLEVKEDLPPSQRSKIGVHSTLGRVLRRYLALGGATSSADGLVGEICREFELPVVHIGEGRVHNDEAYALFESSEERGVWIREELASLATSGEGAWVLCATMDSVEAMKELGVQAGIEFADWEGDTADPRNAHVLCAQLGHETPFGPEGTVVGPPVVIIADCLDALHMERQLLARLQPNAVKRCVSLEDDLLAKLLPERVIACLRWLCGRAPRLRSPIARAVIKYTYSRAEAARRKVRRAYQSAEEEEHRQLAFTGPPSA